MTDGAYTRLRNMMDSPAYDVPLRVRQPLQDVLDAYKRAVETHTRLRKAAGRLKQADEVGMPLGGPLNALWDALEEDAVLDEARKHGVPGV